MSEGQKLKFQGGSMPKPEEINEVIAVLFANASWFLVPLAFDRPDVERATVLCLYLGIVLSPIALLRMDSKDSGRILSDRSIR